MALAQPVPRECDGPQQNQRGRQDDDIVVQMRCSERARRAIRAVDDPAVEKESSASACSASLALQPTHALLVLGHAVAEALARRRKLAQLVPDHLVGDGHGNVVLAVVDQELKPAESGCERTGGATRWSGG